MEKLISASCSGMTIKQKLLLNIFTIIIFFINFCDGQTSNTAAMFEIKGEDQKSYMLRDCRKMAADDIDCKCVHLDRECQQVDVENCTNCSCLDNQSKRIFYIKKRYGALCLSPNNLFNAAGFGERFLIYNPIHQPCAQANTTKIQHTKDCNFNDLRRVWQWTSGNLLMNAETSTCLQAEKGSGKFLSFNLKQCNSIKLGQKWRCEKNGNFILWGISFDSPDITYAVRYSEGTQNLALRNVTWRVNQGNTWTVFPTNNESVCSAIYREGSFYLSDENLETSQIDLVPSCSNDSCSKKLLTTTSSDNLSNCSLLWDENFSSYSEPSFIVHNREDGIYFMWKSNPYAKLAGKTLDLTVECVNNNTKFEEFLFRVRVKNVIIEAVKEHYQIVQTSNGKETKVVELKKNCEANLCTAVTNLNKEATVCAIQWKESTLSRADDTSVPTEKIRKLLSLKKVEEEFVLEWRSTNVSSLANIEFNLTILCYNDKNTTSTTVEKSYLVFFTKHSTSTTRGSEKSSADKTSLYLAIFVPLVVVVLIVIVLILCFLRRKKRMKKSTSRDNLKKHTVVEHQYSSTSMVNGQAIESRSEDNPVYEQCIAVAHPAVTIARNKIYECTNGNAVARSNSDVYEQPLPSVKVSENKFYASFDLEKNSPKLKPHPTPGTKAEPSPNLVEKPIPKPMPAKRPPTPPRYKVPKVIHPPGEDDFYDQPLSFIPSLRRNDTNEMKDEIPLQDIQGQRVHSTYEKPLPKSPPVSGIYEYVTREELSSGPTRCEAEKPLEKKESRGQDGNVTSNDSLNDTPHYDVLEMD